MAGYIVSKQANAAPVKHRAIVTCGWQNDADGDTLTVTLPWTPSAQAMVAMHPLTSHGAISYPFVTISDTTLSITKKGQGTDSGTGDTTTASIRVVVEDHSRITPAAMVDIA